MRYVLALLAVVNAWGIRRPASRRMRTWSEPGIVRHYQHGGVAERRAEPDRNTAVVKEGEFEFLETIAAIERNREARERTVVMYR